MSGAPLARCPLRLVQLADDSLSSEIQRWRHQYFPLFQKGHLLVPGGISAQPARWLSAMLYLEDLEGRKESKFMEIKYPDPGEASA